MTGGETTDAAAQHVRLEKASQHNFFIYRRETETLIGRVWREPNGEWWATFYLSGGSNVSGGKFDSDSDAIAEVWKQAQADA